MLSDLKRGLINSLAKSPHSGHKALTYIDFYTGRPKSAPLK